MSARRVGFGGDEPAPKPERTVATGAPAAETGATGEDDSQEMSVFGKSVLSFFLIAWLIGWSIGLWEMGKLMPKFFGEGDWFSLGFGVVWLTFGAVGWIIAMLILLAVLFGRKRDPDKPSRFQLNKAARRELREARRRLRGRD